MVEKKEDPQQSVLTRRITTFRKDGDYYRCDQEVHCVRLYRSTAIAHQLRQVGFKVQTTRSYGQYQLPHAHAAFIARKPTVT
ncbi:MAG: hypothetical protein AAGA83_11640 [Cyanobacteria bacterium P01_F01_bin.116]